MVEDLGSHRTTLHHGAAMPAVLAEDLAALFGRFKRRLREQAEAGDLPPSHGAVLLRLEKGGPATASGLARAEGMRAQSMGPIIAALLGAGLVVGTPDSEDRRQTILSLTQAGCDRIGAGRAARRDWLSRTIQGRLSPSEQHELAAALALLRRLVDD